MDKLQRTNSEVQGIGTILSKPRTKEEAFKDILQMNISSAKTKESKEALVLLQYYYNKIYG